MRQEGGKSEYLSPALQVEFFLFIHAYNIFQYQWSWMHSTTRHISIALKGGFTSVFKEEKVLQTAPLYAKHTPMLPVAFLLFQKHTRIIFKHIDELNGGVSAFWQ